MSLSFEVAHVRMGGINSQAGTKVGTKRSDLSIEKSSVNTSCQSWNLIRHTGF